MSRLTPLASTKTVTASVRKRLEHFTICSINATIIQPVSVSSSTPPAAPQSQPAATFTSPKAVVLAFVGMCVVGLIAVALFALHAAVKRWNPRGERHDSRVQDVTYMEKQIMELEPTDTVSKARQHIRSSSFTHVPMPTRAPTRPHTRGQSLVIPESLPMSPRNYNRSASLPVSSRQQRSSSGDLSERSTRRHN